MQVTVTTIIFGLPSGRRILQTPLTLPVETITVHELVAHKIRQEVTEVAARQRPGLSGEHLPAAILIRADPAGILPPGDIDAEVEQAQRAFQARDFMVVVDNQRLVDPKAPILLYPAIQIEFIKILPLVGG